MREREEEMELMREHTFKESDTNQDRLISLEEFLGETKRAEYQNDPGWDTLDKNFDVKANFQEFMDKKAKDMAEKPAGHGDLGDGLVPPAKQAGNPSPPQPRQPEKPVMRQGT